MTDVQYEGTGIDLRGRKSSVDFYFRGDTIFIGGGRTGRLGLLARLFVLPLPLMLRKRLFDDDI